MSQNASRRPTNVYLKRLAQNFFFVYMALKRHNQVSDHQWTWLCSMIFAVYIYAGKTITLSDINQAWANTSDLSYWNIHLMENILGDESHPPGRRIKDLIGYLQGLSIFCLRTPATTCFILWQIFKCSLSEDMLQSKGQAALRIVPFHSVAITFGHIFFILCNLPMGGWLEESTGPRCVV